MAGRSLVRISLELFLMCAFAAIGGTTSCKYIPGDSGWPNVSDWAQLNNTVGGRLIVTTPQASVCHISPFSDYNETACESLAARWTMGQTMYVMFASSSTLLVTNHSAVQPVQQSS
jgi:hypothetical protein